MKKLLYKIILLLLVVTAGAYVWQVHFNYRFEEIAPNKVYKSALIPPDKLESYLLDKKIKTVIDLLDPGVQDRLNPAQQRDIDAEASAIEKINRKNSLNILHVNIPSGQVPNRENLKKFYEVLDDKSNYPLLIHCYHGMGRAHIYSAIYRLEYEKWKNEDARAKTRFMVEGFGYRSSFADGKEKGDFLMNYKPRSAGSMSTLETLKE